MTELKLVIILSWLQADEIRRELMAECSNCGPEAAAEALGVKSSKDEGQCSKYKMRTWDNNIIPCSHYSEWSSICFLFSEKNLDHKNIVTGFHSG